MKLMYHIAKKEITEQLRDKRTLWLSILIPLLLIPGILFIMDRLQFSDQPTIQIGVSSQVPSELQTIIKKSTGFQLKSVTSENAKKQIRQGDLEAYLDVQVNGTHFPKQWILEIPADSRFKTLIQSQFNQHIIQQYLAQKNIALSELPTIQDKPVEGPPNLFSGFYMISILLGLTPITGGITIAIDAIAGEKERRTIVSLLGLPIPTWKLWVGKWMAITGMTSITTLVSLGSLIGIQPFLTNPSIQINQLISIGIVPLVGFVLCILFYVLLLSALLLIISTFARSFKEAQSYFSPLMLIVMAGTFVIMQQTGSQLPAYLFWIPIWNVHAILYEILHQSVVVTDVIITFTTNAILSLFLIWYGAFLFQKPKYML